MAYAPMDSDDLKNMVLMGKKRTMNFAYNPGPRGADLLIIDRLKAPEVLGRLAKKHGAGKKIAMGTFVLKRKEITLTVSAEIPDLARKFRKYLKTLDFSFTVEVIDQDGALVQLELSDDTLQDGRQPAANQADVPVSEEDTATATQVQTLTGRLRALQSPIVKLSAEGAPQMKAIADVVKLLKAGKLAEADIALAKIEDSISTKADHPASGFDTRSFVARAGSLQAVLKDRNDAETHHVKVHLVQALTALKARDFASAQTALTTAEKTLKGLPNKPVIQPDRTPPHSQKKWAAVIAPLQARVEAAQHSAAGDPKAIARAFDLAKSQADAGDFDSAVATAKTAVRLLKTAASIPTEMPTEAQLNTVSYAKSLLNWVETRHRLQAQLDKLRMAIKLQTEGVEGLEDIAQNTSVLFDYLDELDTSLETTLEALSETPDGTIREKLKDDAIKVIGTYRTTLDTDFFKAVDDNGFTKTTIRSTAIDALNTVETALSA